MLALMLILVVPCLGQAGPIINLSNSDVTDASPAIDATGVVWSRWDGHDREVVFWDGDTTTPITDNGLSERDPGISGSFMTWSYEDPSNAHREVYFGGPFISNVAITNNDENDTNPEISGSSVVWSGWDDNEPDGLADNYEIYLWDYDTGLTTQITNDAAADMHPSISGDYVVWLSDRDGDFDVYFWDRTDPETITNVSDSIADEYEPDISGSKVVWRHKYQIYLWDAVTPEIAPVPVTDPLDPSDGAAAREPAISGSNVVWKGWDGSDQEIYFWDGSTTTQVTDNDVDDETPDVYDFDVVWSNDEDGDSDIYMTTIPEPSSTALSVAAIVVLACLRRARA